MSQMRKLLESIDQFDKDPTNNPTDVIKLDVPLLIRLLEYAKEDAGTDMDLHKVAEQLVLLSQADNTLTMSDYDSIINQNADELKWRNK